MPARLPRRTQPAAARRTRRRRSCRASHFPMCADRSFVTFEYRATMNRVRSVRIGERDAKLHEHALAIGGLPVRWILDDAHFEDGSRPSDDELWEAGIR